MIDANINGKKFEERPSKLEGKTFRINSACGNMHITINKSEDYPIFEIFTVGGRNGSCNSIFLDVINNLVSRCLRLGDDPREIVKELKHYQCPKANKQEEISCPKAISKAMKNFIEEKYDWKDIDGFEKVEGINSSEQEIKDNNSEDNYFYGGEEEKDKNETNNEKFKECPDCGEKTLTTGEGCGLCMNCGFSPCK